MSEERAESLSPEAREWVEGRATELDLPRTEVLARALTAYRYLVEEGGDIASAAPEDGVDAASVEELRDRLDEQDDRLREVRSHLDRAESDVDEKLTDVRERVVQVKRETDRKAPTDHDHSDLEARVARAEESAERVDELAATVEDGFDNFEEVLSYLTDTSEELESKVDVLASVAVDVRGRLAELESKERRRRAAREIRERANRHGETKAACEDCGTKVHVGLLDEPVCPECRAIFDDIDPSRGFFGSATLTVGDRPALVGDAENPPEDATDLFAEADDGGESDGGDESDDASAANREEADR